MKKIRKYGFILGIISIISFFYFAKPASAVSGAIADVFPDPILAEAIRNELQLSSTADPIDDQDLQTITELVVVGDFNNEATKIKDLTGIEYLTEVERLVLEQHDLKDLGALKNLQADKLRALYLSGNPLSSLDGMPYFPALNTLFVEGNSNGRGLLSDISPLDQYKNQLEFLYLSRNSISSIDELSDFTKLKALVVGRNYLTDISVVKNMPNLYMLMIDENDISDIGSVTDLSMLEYFHAYKNNISDITALKNKPMLKSLLLHENHIMSIEALNGMDFSNFIDLSLHDQTIDLEPIVFEQTDTISIQNPVIKQDGSLQDNFASELLQLSLSSDNQQLIYTLRDTEAGTDKLSFSFSYLSQKGDAPFSGILTQPFTTNILAPYVVDITPSGEGQPISGSVTIVFNEDMDPARIGDIYFNGVLYSGTGQWSDARTFTIPYADFEYSTHYAIRVENFYNLLGVAQIPSDSFSFSTIGRTTTIPETGGKDIFLPSSILIISLVLFFTLIYKLKSQKA